VTDTDPYIARARELIYACPVEHALNRRGPGFVCGECLAAELRRHAEEVATFAGAGDRAIAMLVEAERERDAALARVREL